MQTLTPDQKHTISGTDDKTQRGLKREVQDQQAYLKQIDEEIKTTTKDTTLDEEQKEETLKYYDKENYGRKN